MGGRINDLYFEQIYSKTYDYIYRFLVVKIDSKSSIEDIIQNVYLEFYQRLQKGGKDYFRNEKHYLLKIAKGIVSEYYITNEKHQHESIDEFEIVDGKSLLEIENDDRFSFYEILSTLKNSDDLVYRIFILHYKYDYTISKTAKLLKIPEETVKSKIYRTQRKLKERYKEVQEK